MAPRTRYAKCGRLNLAYQVFGEGPLDIVVVPSFVTHLEFQWAHPAIKAWLDRLATFARVTMFDKAGVGLSDPVASIPTLEDRAREIEAIMDEVGAEQPVLFGLSEGGPASIFFAATRPERVRALVLFGSFAVSEPYMADSREELSAFLAERGIEQRFLPDERRLERVREFERFVRESWGEGLALKQLIPHQGDVQSLAMLERMSASPGMAVATLESGARIDVTDALASISVPTLVIHARDDLVPVEAGRYIADRIPTARMLEVDGVDHAPWLSDPDAIADEIERFLTGARGPQAADRALATVMFTDIVSSTERAAELGDARWRALLERHDELTCEGVSRFGGRSVKSTGDGHLATFDGPAKAIRCAEGLRDSLREVAIDIRAGIHTGECEMLGEDVGGLAVHIAARVCAQARPAEVLVSRTVRDLVVGSGIAFTERGPHELKGVPGRWELLAVGASEESDPDPSRIATPGPGEAMRASDRVAARVVRRAPGVVRAVNRLRAGRAQSRRQ